MFLNKGQVMFVDERGAAGGEKNADGDRNEHETSRSGRVALALLEDDRIRDEKHVEEPVEHRHVQGDEQDDELLYEQLERPDEEYAKTFAERSHVEVLLRHILTVTCFLAEFLGPPGQDRRGVGLRNSEGDDDPDKSRKNQLEPVEPSPSECIRKEATNQWADYRGKVVSLRRQAPFKCRVATY